MFLAVDHSDKVRAELPRRCTFQQSDWHILAAFWHPIAFLHEVKDRPFSVKLLDLNLVVYRTGKGITVAKDLCMHRGTRVSMGSMRDDMLICPMHGLHYDSQGACRKIPSIADANVKIPEKLRLQIYQSKERYGLLWVCLKEKPLWPMPEWPELEQEESAYELVTIPVSEWDASASRETENFFDLAHHPFVHTRTFGNPDRPEIPHHTVEETERGLRLCITRYEIERGWHEPGRSGERLTDYVYDLTYPFAKDLYTEGKEDGIKCHFYDVASPVSANRTRIFQLNLTNNLYCSKEDYAEYQLVTDEEDRICVEAQRPEELPLDLREEIHIPADRLSLKYRKVLADQFGLGAPFSS